MKHNPVLLNPVKDSEFKLIDPESYDQGYTFSDSKNGLRLKATHTNSGSEHMPLHGFGPWGWDLNNSLIRKYNIFFQKNYHSDIYFYSLAQIKLKNINRNRPIIDQIAERWLEAGIEHKVLTPDEPFMLMGSSFGGLIAAAIAAKADDYNLTIGGDLCLFEPAGMAPKSWRTMLKQVSSDTKQDFHDSYGTRLQIKRAKLKTFRTALRNSYIQAKCIEEISAAPLQAYVDKYLKTQTGNIGIGHGANSSFMTFEEMDAFGEQLVSPNRVESADFIDGKHGFGGKVLELSDWLSNYMATHQ